MYLALVFAVDLIEQVKPENGLADSDLIAILELFTPVTSAIEIGPVSRVKVVKKVR